VNSYADVPSQTGQNRPGPGALTSGAKAAEGREARLGCAHTKNSRTGSQAKGRPREKKIALIEKMNPAVGGPGRALPPGNAAAGKVHQENSLSQHGRGCILGMLRLCASELHEGRILVALCSGLQS
jgi:hypothetical protein